MVLYCTFKRLQYSMLLLLLRSRFSRVRLCATPEPAAHQAPPSRGFCRQEHWSGVPCPSPVRGVERESGAARYEHRSAVLGPDSSRGFFSVCGVACVVVVSGNEAATSSPSAWDDAVSSLDEHCFVWVKMKALILPIVCLFKRKRSSLGFPGKSP